MLARVSLVEQVDAVGSQALSEASAACLMYFGRLFSPRLFPGLRVDIEAELSRSHHLITQRG